MTFEIQPWMTWTLVGLASAAAYLVAAGVVAGLVRRFDRGMPDNQEALFALIWPLILLIELMFEGVPRLLAPAVGLSDLISGRRRTKGS